MRPLTHKVKVRVRVSVKVWVKVRVEFWVRVRVRPDRHSCGP